MHVGDPDVREGVLAGPGADPLDLDLAALVRLLDPLRMDPAVGDQRLQGQPADLPADRVEAGEQHRLRCLVDHQVHPGDRLEGADVAALAADDPALHLVTRQAYHRHHGVRGLLHRDPLHRRGDDVPGPALRLGVRPRLDLARAAHSLALGLLLDLVHQLQPCGHRRQAGDPLQFEPALGLREHPVRAQLLALPCQHGLRLGRLDGPFVEPALLGVESGLALGTALLTPLVLAHPFPRAVQQHPQHQHRGQENGRASSQHDLHRTSSPAPCRRSRAKAVPAASRRDCGHAEGTLRP